MLYGKEVANDLHYFFFITLAFKKLENGKRYFTAAPLQHLQESCHPANCYKD